jgi:hypothetical protein
MSGRTTTEAVGEVICIIPEPLSEVRRIIQNAVDLHGISREEAIQQTIDSWTTEKRTPSQIVAIDSTQGRIILNYAHSWNQKPVDEHIREGGLSDLDEEHLRAEMFARNLNLKREQAQQILRIAREEAAGIHQ